MHNQFSIGAPNLSFSPFGQRAKNLSYIVARVESESFWQDINQVKLPGFQTIVGITFWDWIV
jgi:hypothetical protein